MNDVSNIWAQYFTDGTDIVSRVFHNTWLLSDIRLDEIRRDWNKTKIVLSFYAEKLPSYLPKKWHDKGIQALSFQIVMSELTSLNLRAQGMGLVCTPHISKQDNIIEFGIHHRNIELLCKSRDLLLCKVMPVFD